MGAGRHLTQEQRRSRLAAGEEGGLRRFWHPGGWPPIASGPDRSLMSKPCGPDDGFVSIRRRAGSGTSVVACRLVAHAGTEPKSGMSD